MTRKMADSVTVANLPEGFDLYGAYVDGLYKNYAQAEARFPGKVVGIAVFSTTNDGIVGDCETGDMSPQQAVLWTKMRREAGVDPTIYTSLANWPACRQAFNQLSVAHPHWWIAAYPGLGPVVYPGSVAHQWIDHGPYDESVVADYWPGVDRPPQPPIQEEDMELYATNTQGVGFVVAADLSFKRGLPTADDAKNLLATGLYKQVKLDDALLNEIPG